MVEKPWAEIDDDWKRKEERALAQRAANAAAVRAGEPAPYVNPFLAFDPTKLEGDASPSEVQRRYREFCKICPPFRPKRHTI
ncbi:MAG: hypothetical protein V3T72_05355 [Thermoanaerobaculia bacterium]